MAKAHLFSTLTDAAPWRSGALRLRPLSPTTAILLCAGFVFVYLIVRNCGLRASVFDDEWIYSEFSRLAPRSEAPVPSYLFFFLFGTTRFFGDGFLECARIYNAALFAVAFVFIYQVCRLYTSHKLALFVALLSVLAPIHNYSAYFMPESMYFCAFWILTWSILRNLAGNPWILGCGAGCIVGLMALIKFHAVFLLPGLVAFFCLVWITKFAGFTLPTLIRVLVTGALSFIIIRIVLGFLLAGPPGLKLAGKLYGSIGSSVHNTADLATILPLGWHSLAGHLLVVCLLLSVPLAAIACVNLKRMKSAPESGAKPESLYVYAGCLLVPLILVAAFSTAMFANGSPYDTINRLHLRYYNFVFPLFFIIAACELSSTRQQSLSRIRIIVVILLAVIGLAIVFGALRTYTPNIVDSPELAVFYTRQIFLSCAALGSISVLIWSVQPRIGAGLYLFLFLPLFLGSSVQSALDEISGIRVSSVYEDAGRFARQLLGMRTAKLSVVSSELLGAYETLFYIDNPSASIVQISPDSVFETSMMPPGKIWALVVGDHKPNFVPRYQLSLSAYSLINLAPDYTIDFSDHAWPSTIENVTGLSAPESFGRWTDGPEATLEFVSPLPKKFRIQITARAIGPNVGLPFILKIGRQEQQFRLTTTFTEVTLPFETDGTEHVVRISTPKPISPRQLWNLPDDRHLGAALQRLSIVE
jgi:phosphoglycerol transferase